MHVFKPLQLSLQTKSFIWQKKNYLAVTVLLGFPFDPSKDVLLEQELWNFLPEQLGTDTMLDMGMPKPQGEVLVYGNYFAPGSNPVTADQINLSMGSVDKTLAVIGDRYWRLVLGATAPEPFTEMPVDYPHAFGGKDHKPNPIGKGMEEVDVYGEKHIPLPNIEYPHRLITSPDHRPEPAGFAPLDMMWQKRAGKMGTYDEEWKQEYFPGYPPDLDWTHFNAATDDQWISEFWQGDEEFQLTNMHPKKQHLKGNLPAFRARCFIKQTMNQQPAVTEVDMHAETVFLFPQAETAVLLFRGTIEVMEDDATDVEHLLAGYEDLSQTPRSQEHYSQAIFNRLDDEKAIRFMLSTKDIIPHSERCGFERMLDDLDMGSDSELGKNLDARVEEEKQKAEELVAEKKQELSEQLTAAGLDPKPYLKKYDLPELPDEDPHMLEIKEILEKILPGITLNDPTKLKLGEVDLSKFKELDAKFETYVQEKKDAIKKQLLDSIEEVEGSDIEQQVREKIELAIKQMDEPAELPRPSADESLLQLKQQVEQIEQAREILRSEGVEESRLPVVDIDFKDIEQKIHQGIDKLKATYLSGAHLVEGKPPHDAPLDIMQYRLQKWLDKGDTLAGRDLSGLDLSGMNLSGMDLSGCYLEYARLKGTNLRGANLARAIITHADLSQADLTGADLTEANLGDSLLEQATIADTRMRKLILSKARLEKTRFINCNMEEVKFLEATLPQAEFNNCIIQLATFLEMDFNGSSFINSRLQQCSFLQCTLEQCDFSNSNLSSTNFVECKLNYSRFSGARMTNIRFPGGCELNHCRFDHTQLDKANLRDISAEDSDFEFSSFSEADFSGANLRRSKFYGSSGKRALFIKSGLA